MYLLHLKCKNKDRLFFSIGTDCSFDYVLRKRLYKNRKERHGKMRGKREEASERERQIDQDREETSERD